MLYFNSRKDARDIADHLDPETEREGGPEGREGAESEEGLHAAGLQQMGQHHGV